MIANPAVLAPYFTRNITVTAVTTTAVKMLGINPNRVALIFSILQSTGALVLPDSSISSQRGNNLQGNVSAQPTLTFAFQDFGSLICGEWWAITTGSSTSILAIEVIYLPPPVSQEGETN